jgi:hypothetical protein
VEGVSRDTSGFHISIDNNRQAWIKRTFVGPGPQLTTSVLTLDLMMTFAGSSLDGDDKVGLVFQYLGQPATGFPPETAANLIELTKDGLAVTVWSSANTPDPNATPKLVPSGVAGADNFISTRWASNGAIVFHPNTDQTTTVTAQTSTMKSNEFTLVMGGRASGSSPPTTTITLRGLCVTLL